MNIRFSIPVDSDGFRLIKCPKCGVYFKIQGAEKLPENLYCYSCGLFSKVSDFHPPEVKEHTKALAYNWMAEELNKAFGKGTMKKKTPNVLKVNDRLDFFHLNCCDKDVKIERVDTVLTVFCPFCGRE